MEGVTIARNGEEFKGREKRILVQSLSAGFINGKDLGLPGEEGEKGYQLTEFRLIDLKEDIPIRCLPSLVRYVMSGSVVALDNSVYVFGGLNPRKVQSDGFKMLQYESPKSYQTFELGGSRLDFDPDQSQGEREVWVPAPIPVKDRDSFNCFSLLGKIYTFSSSRAPEVLDPTLGHWRQFSSIPTLVADRILSSHPLPDPSKNRIFVNFSSFKQSSPSLLYAFNPPSETWVCVDPNFKVWSSVAVVVEDVIYLHSHKFPSLLHAYDIGSKTLLEVSWASCFKNNVDMNNQRMEFDALISLGDRVFCFAESTTLFNDDLTHTRIQINFFKFRVVRSRETISLIPLSSHSYELPATDQVLGFLPI